MAIPISLPSSEDVEDSYRTLDSLLEQLLITVRQVLVQRRQQQQDLSTLRVARQRSTNSSLPSPTTTPNMEQPQRRCSSVPRTPEQSPTSSPLRHPRLPLPDLIPESASFECEDSRRKDVSSPATPEMSSSTSVSTWVQVGCDLRLIADNFHAERAPQQNADGKCSRTKEPSLVSLLSPAFGKSIWTTVALLLGWGLFSRTR